MPHQARTSITDHMCRGWMESRRDVQPVHRGAKEPNRINPSLRQAPPSLCVCVCVCVCVDMR